MAATQAPASSSSRRRTPPRAKGSSSSGALTQDWHGLPVWAWVGIGAVSVAGLYVFVRGYRKAAHGGSTATGASPGNTALPEIPALPPLPALPQPAPPTTLPPVGTLPPLPVPAGTIGRTFSAQDVRDIFTRYGFSRPEQIAAATVKPSSETADERVARIMRELNSGDRSLAQVTDSISKLPGSAALPRAA